MTRCFPQLTQLLHNTSAIVSMNVSYSSRKPKGESFVVLALLVQTVGIVFYWVTYFQTKNPFDHSYKVYEDAFVLADSLVAVNTGLCLYHLLLNAHSKRHLALMFGYLSIGGTWFIGCEDILFNLQNHMYPYIFHGNVEQRENMIIETIVNIWCVLAPSLLLFWFNANRLWFLKPLFFKDRSNLENLLPYAAIFSFTFCSFSFQCFHFLS